MNLEFFVSGRKLTKKGIGTPIVDTAGCDTFTIDFDKEWDGLVKLVVLQNGEDTAQVLYFGKTPLPRQICGRGNLYLTCYGYRKKGDTVAVIQTVPMVRPVCLLGSTAVQPGTDQPYTPSVFEQMTAQVAAARAAAEKAEAVAEQMLSWKEQGFFKGPTGPAATVRVDSVRKGEPARVENLGSDRNAILRFTLPYKDELTQDDYQRICEEVELRLVGDISAALDEILTIQQQYLGEVTV